MTAVDTTEPDLTTVAAIPDPLERAKAIAEVIVPADKELREARTRRDLAGIMLAEQGWPPVKVYTLIGVSRGLFVRMRRRAPEKLPKMTNPEKVATEAAATVKRLEDVVKAWRPLRDETIAELFDTHPELSNVEIGRLFGTTGQRITIMRTQGR